MEFYAAAYNRTNNLFLLAECFLLLVNLLPPTLQRTNFFHRLLYLFVMCVGIGSVQMGEPSICNKHGCDSPRPQQFNKPLSPELPAVPLSKRRQRDGR